MNDIQIGIVNAVRGWVNDAGLSVVFGSSAHYDHDRRQIGLHSPVEFFPKATDDKTAIKQQQTEMNDIWLGEALHEIGHAMDTDPEWRPIDREPADHLGMGCYRSLEDARIDSKTQRRRAGGRRIFEASFSALKRHGYWEPAEFNEGDSLVELFFLWLLYAARSRVCMQSPFFDLDKHADPLLRKHVGDDFVDRAWQIASRVSYAASTQDVYYITQDLRKLLEQIAQEPPKEEQDQSGDGQSNEQPQSDQSSSIQDQDQGQGDSSTGDAKPDQGQQSDPDGSGKAASAAGSDSQSDPQGGGSDAQTGTSSDQADAARRLASQLLQAQASDIPRETDVGDLLSEQFEASAFAARGDGAADVVLAEVLKAKPYGTLQMAAGSHVMGMRLQRLLEARTFVQLSHDRVGDELDFDILHRSELGDRDLFLDEIRHIAPNTAIDVVLDTSYSMQRNDRIGVARRAALAMVMAFRQIAGVSVGAIAFPAIGDRQGNAIQELLPIGEDASRYATSFHSLAAYGGTPMDTAVLESGLRLLARPEPRKIMAVLTDGSPSSGTKPKTQSHINYLLSKGVEVVAVGIECMESKDLFPVFELVSDVNQLEGALTKLLTRTLSLRKAA